MPSVSLATQAFKNYRDFDEFPPDMQRDARRALTAAAEGGKGDKSKPFKGVEGGVFEI